jgi:hypothetical protein
MLRGNFQTKDRLYRNLLERMRGMSKEELEAVQHRICKKYALDSAEIEKALLASTKNGVVQSTDREDQIKQNKQRFDQ